MTPSRLTRPLLLALLSLGAVMPLTGCLMVGGYSSGGGWFIWPGSFGFLIILLLLFFFLRRRR